MSQELFFTDEKINTVDIASPEHWQEYTTTLYKNQVTTVRHRTGNRRSYVNPISGQQSNAWRNQSTFELSGYGTYETHSFQVSYCEINGDYNRLFDVVTWKLCSRCSPLPFARTKSQKSNATIWPKLNNKTSRFLSFVLWSFCSNTQSRLTELIEF